jgi:fermentation-respiration switch protein FrsA (DUF1100 family)
MAAEARVASGRKGIDENPIMGFLPARRGPAGGNTAEAGATRLRARNREPLLFRRAKALAARLWRRERRPAWVSHAIIALMAVVVVFLCAYLGFAAMLYVTQRSMMYFPETMHTTPAQAGLPSAEEVTLTAADGVKSIAWHVPPRGDRPVILYFHGNGGALRHRVDRFSRLLADGIGLVALEYRGYGGSTGSPTEAGLIADGEAAYAFAAARYPVKELVLWGESLGSGIAVPLAANKPVGRVILEAPFTSAAAVAGARYWYLPVRLLMKDQFRSDEHIGKVTAPVLILHGARDRVVPFAMGERLFEATKAPKHIVRFLDGDHEDLDAHGALHAVGRFLAGDLDR